MELLSSRLYSNSMALSPLVLTMSPPSTLLDLLLRLQRDDPEKLHALPPNHQAVPLSVVSLLFSIAKCLVNHGLNLYF